MAKNLISNTLKENHLCLGSKCIALIIIYATIMREGWHSAIVAVAFLHCKKGEANFSQFPFLPKNAPNFYRKSKLWQNYSLGSSSKNLHICTNSVICRCLFIYLLPIWFFMHTLYKIHTILLSGTCQKN